MNNVDKLRKAMKDYGLTYKDAAELMDVSLHTVKSWLINERSAKHRRFTDKNARYLMFRLRSRKKV